MDPWDTSLSALKALWAHGPPLSVLKALRAHGAQGSWAPVNSCQENSHKQCRSFGIQPKYRSSIYTLHIGVLVNEAIYRTC